MISFFHRKNKVDHIAWLGVDMHNHLLPGIDDGAVDIGQSVCFINELVELGFNKFYCTPHIFTELYPNNAETIGRALASVKTVLIKEKPKLEIHAAAEYMIDETFDVTANLMCLPGKHVLIEMSYLAEMPDIERVIFELQIRGFRVILAHPERYSFYHKKPERYQRLREMGVLFQLNLLSVSGCYGKEVASVATNLLHKGNYDFAGTDLHHQQHLTLLQKQVYSGRLHKSIGHYPFRNNELL